MLETRPRSGRLIVILLKLLLVTVLLMIFAYGVLTLPPVTRAFGEYISHEVAARSGVGFSCASARLSFGGVWLRDVALERGGKPLLFVERVLVTPSWTKLIGREICLRTVDGVGFTLLIPTSGTARASTKSDLSDSSEAGLRRKLARVLDPGGFQLVLRDGEAVVGAGTADELPLQVALLRAHWPRPGEYPIEGKLVLRESGGKGSVSVTAATLGEGTGASIHVYGPGIPTEPFRDRLHLLLPASLVAKVTPILDRIPQLPIVGGSFDAEYDARAKTISLRGEIGARGMTIQDENLASVPIGPVDLVQYVSVAVYLKTNRVLVDEWEGQVNKVAYQVMADIEPVKDDVKFIGSFDFQKVPYQNFLDSIPEGVAPALAGVRLGGSLDLHLELAGTFNDPESLTTKLDIDWSRLRLELPSEPLRGARPLKGFVYVPYSKIGVRREFRLGRDQPAWVPFESIPSYMVDALLASEDINFYKHEGFDVEGLKLAFEMNLKARKAVRGGSTITQQLAKNLFLSRERTFIRKFQEAVLAWEMEKIFTKDQLLELYVNIIEWGPGLYGLGRAADHYFGKEASELTLKEAAYLCTIIPNPVRYYRFFEERELSPKWEKQLRSLLWRMRSFDFITEEQYRNALIEPLRFNRPPKNVDWLKIAEGLESQDFDFE